MIFSFVCSLFLSFVCAQVVLHDFGNKQIYDYDFFTEVPKNQFDVLSLEKKQEAFDSFIKKELALYEAGLLGLDLKPSVLLLLEERKKQLAVNYYYERFVAAPLVSPFYVESTKQNLKKELLVYHLLIGYDGCALSGGPFPSLSVASDSALFLSVKIQKALSEIKEFKDRASFFKKEASLFSNDPAAKDNFGLLGWVSWGRAIDDFQLPLFLLKAGEVSSPILTPYGLHVVFVEKERLSDFAYYDPLVLEDLVYKASLQSVPFDSLRAASALHDSLLLGDGGFAVNPSFVSSLVDDLSAFLKKDSARGGKKQYLSFLKNRQNDGVLFVYKKRGFGLGWLVSHLEKTPSTRIPFINTKEDLVSLITTFLLQEQAFLLAQKNNVLELPSVARDFLGLKKNILYNELLKHKSFLIGGIDSSAVKEKYHLGLKDSLFFSPRKALVYDLVFEREGEARDVLLKINEGEPFDSLFLSLSKTKTKKTISYGSRGLLGEAAFSLEVGGVSKIIANTDKTFSIIKVLGFLPPEPLPLSSVYKTIEKKMEKEKKNKMKNNIIKDLKEKFGFSFDVLEL